MTLADGCDIQSRAEHVDAQKYMYVDTATGFHLDKPDCVPYDNTKIPQQQNQKEDGQRPQVTITKGDQNVDPGNSETAVCTTESEDNQVIYADILHTQSDDDDMVLTDNDIYHVTADDSSEKVPASTVQKTDFQTKDDADDDGDDGDKHGDDDDDLILTDNGLYTVAQDIDEVKEGSTSSKEEDADTDMVIMDNDFYNTNSHV